MPPSPPTPQPQPAAPTPQAFCCGPRLFPRQYECLIQSQLGRKKQNNTKNRGCKEDPPPKSRSLPGLGHLDRAPVSLTPSPPPPTPSAQWQRLWREDSPSITSGCRKRRPPLPAPPLLGSLQGGGGDVAGRSPGSRGLQQPFPHSQEAPHPIPEADPSTKNQGTEGPIGPIFEAVFLSFHSATAFSQP